LEMELGEMTEIHGDDMFASNCCLETWVWVCNHIWYNLGSNVATRIGQSFRFGRNTRSFLASTVLDSHPILGERQHGIGVFLYLDDATRESIFHHVKQLRIWPMLGLPCSKSSYSNYWAESWTTRGSPWVFHSYVGTPRTNPWRGCLGSRPRPAMMWEAGLVYHLQERFDLYGKQWGW
jgi:hypothetical protein